MTPTHQRQNQPLPYTTLTISFVGFVHNVFNNVFIQGCLKFHELRLGTKDKFLKLSAECDPFYGATNQKQVICSFSGLNRRT